jgi:hypothetical protein
VAAFNLTVHCTLQPILIHSCDERYRCDVNCLTETFVAGADRLRHLVGRALFGNSAAQSQVTTAMVMPESGGLLIQLSDVGNLHDSCNFAITPAHPLRRTWYDLMAE